jgi:hypothetical protein
MFSVIAIPISGWFCRRLKCSVDSCLNAASGHGLQPRLGFAGSDGIADLKLPSPDIRFGGRHDAILDAFVEHRKSPLSKNEEGLLSASAINPDNYGIGPAVYWNLCGSDMTTPRAITQKLPSLLNSSPPLR